MLVPIGTRWVVTGFAVTEVGRCRHSEAESALTSSCELDTGKNLVTAVHREERQFVV